MISYEPMQKMLKKRGKSFSSLCKTTGLGSCNTKNTYIKTDTLNKICSMLKCAVEDVVSVVTDDSCMESRVKYLNSDVEFSPLFKTLKDRGLSMQKASLEAGFSASTIFNITIGKKPRYDTLKRLAAYLNVAPEDLYSVKTQVKTGGDN